jgi:hypothetical protein
MYFLIDKQSPHPPELSTSPNPTAALGTTNHKNNYN